MKKIFLLLASFIWLCQLGVESKANDKISFEQLAAMATFATFASNIDAKCGAPKDNGGLPPKFTFTVGLQIEEAAVDLRPSLDGLVKLLIAKAATARFECKEAETYRETIGAFVANLLTYVFVTESTTGGNSDKSAEVHKNPSSLVSKNTYSTLNDLWMEMENDATSKKIYEGLKKLGNSATSSPENQTSEIAKIEQSVSQTTGDSSQTNDNAISKINGLLFGSTVITPGVTEVSLEILSKAFKGKRGRLAGASLHLPISPLSLKQSYFTVLGSFESERSAIRHLKNLRRAKLGLEAVVYPPRIKGSYWIVVGASFASYSEALEEVVTAKKLHLASDAYVWSAWRHTEKLNKKPFRPVSSLMQPASWPDFLTEARADQDGAFYVSVAAAADQETALAKRDTLRSAHGLIPLIVYGPLAANQPWRVLIAAHTVREDAEKAVWMARRIGLSENPEVFRFVEPQISQWLPSDPALEVSSLELKRKVDGCLSAGQLTERTMQKCLGGYLSRDAFAACSDLIEQTPNKLPGSAAIVKCHLESLKSDLETTLDTPLLAQSGEISLLPEDKMAALVACKTKYPSNADATGFYDCAIPLKLTDNQIKAIECIKLPEKDAASCLLKISANGDISKLTEIFECKRKTELAGGVGLVNCFDKNLLPKKLTDTVNCTKSVNTEQALLDCFRNTEVNTEALSCLNEAANDKTVSLMCIKSRDPNLKKVFETRDCLKLSGDNTTKQLECMAKISGKDSLVTRSMACIDKKGDDSALCLAQAVGGIGSDLKKAADIAKCLKEADTGAANQSSCLAKAAGINDKDASVALCIASGKDPLDCATAVNPDLSRGVQAYNCAQSAGDTADMLENCSTAFNIGDKTTVKTAACLARSEGDNGKMAMCAMSSAVKLDEKTQKLIDCAASSQGHVEFALCASGANINAELRIAAECVSSTGGEPYSTVACAGGRLAIREFQKCVSSGMNIGSDNCFGKNNTIRKYWEDMAKVYSDAAKTAYNDFTKGPGEGNDLLKIGKTAETFANTAVKDTEKVVGDLGKASEKTVQEAGKGLEKGAQEVGKGLEKGAQEVEKGVQDLGKKSSEAGQYVADRIGIHW